jgi:hypothetical protein
LIEEDVFINTDIRETKEVVDLWTLFQNACDDVLNDEVGVSAQSVLFSAVVKANQFDCFAVHQTFSF